MTVRRIKVKKLFFSYSQEISMNILPELSDGLNLLLDALVKSSFVIEKQPPKVEKCTNVVVYQERTTYLHYL